MAVAKKSRRRRPATRHVGVTERRAKVEDAVSVQTADDHGGLLLEGGSTILVQAEVLDGMTVQSDRSSEVHGTRTGQRLTPSRAGLEVNLKEAIVRIAAKAVSEGAQMIVSVARAREAGGLEMAPLVMVADSVGIEAIGSNSASVVLHETASRAWRGRTLVRLTP